MRYWTKKEKTKEQVDKQPERKLFILLAILAITFVSFSSTLNNGFLNWDDNSHLVENLSVRSLNIKHIFTSTVDTLYIPLTILSFALEYRFFGLNPFIYHLDNLLLHLVVTGLVFLFALQIGLTARGATFAALLFGIHPMHVESVAWVTERKDVLYAAFYMGALCCYWRYLQDGKIRPYLLSIILGILSILAKPMALSLPLILFVCDWLKGRKLELKVFLEKIPHLMYVIPITWLTYRSHARIPGESFIEGALIWIWTLTFYVKKFIFPFVLAPLYSLPKPVSIYNAQYALAIFVLCGLLICFIWYRRNRWLIFAGLFYFAAIFFLLQCEDIHINSIANRYMYLPSLGICIFLGVLWERISEIANKRSVASKRLVHLCIIVLFSLMCVKTYLQSKIWQDSITFWNYVIQHSPDDARISSSAHQLRGVAYDEQGRYNLALADYNRALDINPLYAKTYYYRGGLYLGRGLYDIALDDFNKVLNINTHFVVDAYNSRGIVWGLKDEHALALNDFNKAIALNSNFIEAYNNRGIIYYNMDSYELALVDFNRVLELDPNCVQAKNNRERVYEILDKERKDKRTSR